MANGKDAEYGQIGFSKVVNFERGGNNEEDNDEKPLNEDDNNSNVYYRMGDVVLVFLIIFPLGIGFWRGVWQIMDYYSHIWHMDPWLSLGIGYSIPFFLHVFQSPLSSVIHPQKMNFVLFYIITRFLLLLHSFGSVNQWRGLWHTLDIYTGLGPWSAVTSLIAGILLNLIFKTFTNVLAPPLICCVDEAYTIHECSLRYRTQPKDTFKYLLDCIASVFWISSLTVLCWRGLWNLLDLYLYPEDELKSSLASLCLGYAICLAMCFLQPLSYVKTNRFAGKLGYMLHLLVTLVSFCGCVFGWRGVWTTYDLWIVIDQPLLASEWITVVVGAVGSVIFGCVSAVVVRGISIDWEDAEEWPLPYISFLKAIDTTVPLPEPWICRYLCTSQKMNIKSSKKKIPPSDGPDGIKLLPRNERKSSVASTNAKGDSPGRNEVAHTHKSALPSSLSNLRHIDSSSEEDIPLTNTSKQD